MANLPNEPDETGLKKKQLQVIELWRETRGHITNACKAAGINRCTYYEWLKDPNFKQAIDDAEAELNDDIRDVLVSKAGEADMTAVIFYLKKRHPDYLERPSLVNAGTVNFNQFLSEERKRFNVTE